MRWSPSVLRLLFAGPAAAIASSCLLLLVAELKAAHLLTLAQAGWVVSAAAGASFAAALLVGPLTRLLGARCLQLLALLFFAASVSWLGASICLTALLLTAFSTALVYAAVFVLGNASLAAQATESPHSVITLQLAGAAVGGASGAWLAGSALRYWPLTATTVGVPWFPVVAGGLTLLCWLPSLIAGDASAGPPTGGLRFPWRSAGLWLLMVMGAAHGACDVGCGNWTPLWLPDRAADGRALVPELISLTFIASLLGRGTTLLIARWAGQTGALRVATTGACVGLVLLLLSHTGWAFIGSFCAYCLFAAGNFPSLLTALGEHSPAWRTELTGLLTAVVGGAGTLATASITRLATAHSDSAAGLPLPLVAMGLLCLLSWLWPWLMRRMVVAEASV
jgi:MFS family permease